MSWLDVLVGWLAVMFVGTTIGFWPMVHDWLKDRCPCRKEERHGR